MNKLTEREINGIFREVISNPNWFLYYPFNNQIQLDGIFCSDELRCIADKMDELFKGKDRHIKKG